MKTLKHPQGGLWIEGLFWLFYPVSTIIFVIQKDIENVCARDSHSPPFAVMHFGTRVKLPFWSIQQSTSIVSKGWNVGRSCGKYPNKDCNLPPEGLFSCYIFDMIILYTITTDLCISNELVPPPHSASLSASIDCAKMRTVVGSSGLVQSPHTQWQLSFGTGGRLSRK